MSDLRAVQLDQRVRLSEQRNAGISWPLAIDRRLDEILELANDRGANTSRKELLAAIVAQFDVTQTDVTEVVLAYRMASVRDVLLNVPETDEESAGAAVFSFRRHRSGPRPKASESRHA